MDNIYITGTTGFVGANLDKYLKKHHKKVVGVSRLENIETSIIDYFGFYNQIKTGDNAIIHLAGKAHDLKNTTDENAYFEINYELTKKIYDVFLQSEASVFIYMSSVKAVADTVEGALTEDAVSNPITVYGKSKQMAEDYILANLPSTKKVYILRPCMIHGPGNKGNLNLLFGLVRKGLPWPLGAFENKRSFCSIENLCFVIKELLDQETIPSGVYNVADDEPLSTNELIQLIATSQKKQARILPVSKGLINGIAKIGGFLHLPLNSERLQKLTESYVVSNAKIKQFIGKPFPINSKEGLLKTFESFKSPI